MAADMARQAPPTRERRREEKAAEAEGGRRKTGRSNWRVRGRGPRRKRRRTRGTSPQLPEADGVQGRLQLAAVGATLAYSAVGELWGTEAGLLAMAAMLLAVLVHVHLCDVGELV